MSKPSLRSIIRYAQACFSWEYSNQGHLNLLSKQLKARCFLSLETYATRLSSSPLLDHAQRQRIAKAVATYPRSSAVMIGLFPLTVDYLHGPTEQVICAPLFTGMLDRAAFERSDTDLVDDHAPVRLLVNQVLLARVLPELILPQTVQALQRWIDAGPVAKSQLGDLFTLLTQALPNLDRIGFDIFPLLARKPNLRQQCKFTRSSGLPALSCSAMIYVTRRSRQSMGVLHELAQMGQLSGFSSPLQQLIHSEAHPTDARGPLNVLGALSTPQRQALRAAREQPLSVVHGPPGTGKTHVLAMIAADQLARGHSVLICARNDAAVAVVEKFLSSTLRIRGAMVRGGTTQHRRDLKARLTALLEQGFLGFADPQPTLNEVCHPEQSADEWPLVEGLAEVERQLKVADRRLAKLAKRIDQHIALSEGNASPALRLKAWLGSFLGMAKPTLYLDSLMRQWRSGHQRRAQLVIDKLQLKIQRGAQHVVAHQRRALAKMARSLTALERNQGALQDAVDYAVMTSALPVWITTLADLSHLLPLRRELFDLVVIDEASQADIASAIPALHRAKRAVIIGDAKQLRHVSFLPRAVETDLRERQNLAPDQAPSFRDDSVLDWVNRSLGSSAASCFLDEHFRSSPDIIGFSNQEFYAGRLKLLTHGRRPAGRNALSLIQVDDGLRNSKGANPTEAEAVLNYLKGLSESSVTPQSVGIVSPFRDQVDHLRRRLERDLDPALYARHRVIVGTAHELQGEERDVVLFSAAVDETAAAGSLAFLSRPEVLNVAITRARHRLVVFLSRPLETFSADTLFGRYLRWVQRAQAKEAELSGTLPTLDAELDVAITELIHALNAEGCQLHTHCLMGSVQVDVLLRIEQEMLGIDLVGFGGHHVLAGLQHHELELMYRMQLPIIPITRDDWTQSKTEVVEQLNRRILSLRQQAERQP